MTVPAGTKLSGIKKTLSGTQTPSKQSSILSFFGKTDSPQTPTSKQLNANPYVMQAEDNHIGAIDKDDGKDEDEEIPLNTRSKKLKAAIVESDDEELSVADNPSNIKKTAKIDLNSFSSPLIRKSANLLPPITPLASQFSDAVEPKSEVSTDEERYPWLVDVRDENKNLPDSPSYDPRTLYIPNSQWSKFTPFEKQFWEIKSKHFDTIMFFKKGKFYELYENDADVGAKFFDLKMTDRINMRMVGVPEASFDFWAAKFIAAGFKVGRVDQMETAIGKTLREKEEPKNQKADKIIKRELTAVLTAGTLVDSSLLSSDTATYCMAIKENDSHYGAAFVDASTAKFYFCQFEDDSGRSKLQTLLAQVKPTEILLEKGAFSKTTLQIIKPIISRSSVNFIIPGKEFWFSEKTGQEIAKYCDAECTENFIQAWNSLTKSELALSAFGGLVWYLRSLKLDEKLLSFHDWTEYDLLTSSGMLLIDGQSLLNLEILENSFDSSAEGTLFHYLDKCVTPFGKRRLKNWVLFPLRSCTEINARLTAIDALFSENDITENMSRILAKLPDLERIIARIHSGSCKLKDFVYVIDAFKKTMTIVDNLRQVEGSVLLSKLSSDYPDLTADVEFFEAAFDHKAALAENSLIPMSGMDDEFDSICRRIVEIEDQFASYLDEMKKLFKTHDLKYRDLGKEIFQLEIPAGIKVSTEFIPMSKTKSVNRYWTPHIKALVKEFQESNEIKSSIMSNLLGRLLSRFSKSNEKWISAISILADLDCLISLCKVRMITPSPICRPEFTLTDKSFIDAKDLRHPTMLCGSAIPNDIQIGCDESKVILLTGPNMGGKSTLLRQTCLAIIMAQIGCYVPASSFRCSIFDRIFTRLGANDNIVKGQSTFLVELLETSKILLEATSKSLIILDELGRGTSTYDGHAIAYSVLDYLITKINCIGLFSTHYKQLTDDFKENPAISLRYMDCLTNEQTKMVTFLYKLVPGVCPKSYGMNVARLAGMPASIVARAEDLSSHVETSVESSTVSFNVGDAYRLAYLFKNQMKMKMQ